MNTQPTKMEAAAYSSSYSPSELNNRAVCLVAQGMSGIDDAIRLFSQELSICQERIMFQEQKRRLKKTLRKKSRSAVSRSPSSLEEERFSEELSSFIVHHLKNVSVEEEEEEQEEEVVVVLSSPTAERRAAVLPEEQEHIARGRQEQDGHSSGFLYHSLILLEAPNELESLSDESKYVDFLSFVGLFNLAVTTHMKARVRNNDATLLLKALRFYELAHDVQSSRNLPVHPCHVMAIVNNIGQIHNTLGEEQEAEQCYKHLLATLMFFVLTGQSPTSDLESFDFLSNTLHFILKDPCTAAAA